MVQSILQQLPRFKFSFPPSTPTATPPLDPAAISSLHLQPYPLAAGQTIESLFPGGLPPSAKQLFIKDADGKMQVVYLVPAGVLGTAPTSTGPPPGPPAAGTVPPRLPTEPLRPLDPTRLATQAGGPRKMTILTRPPFSTQVREVRGPNNPRMLGLKPLSARPQVPRVLTSLPRIVPAYNNLYLEPKSKF